MKVTLKTYLSSTKLVLHSFTSNSGLLQFSWFMLSVLLPNIRVLFSSILPSPFSTPLHSVFLVSSHLSRFLPHIPAATPLFSKCVPTNSIFFLLLPLLHIFPTLLVIICFLLRWFGPFVIHQTDLSTVNWNRYWFPWSKQVLGSMLLEGHSSKVLWGTVAG